jgi:hypothetical protein
MAATNQSGSSMDGVRRFSIGRENGSKTGKAQIMEWLQELPAPQQGRRFETRTSESGKTRHYETYTAIDGVLTGLELRSREIMNEQRTFLIATLDDGRDVQEFEVGDTDGRYSMDLLKTLLNPSMDFQKTIRLAPYAYLKDDKQKMGISVYCGVDQMKWADKDAYKIAEPEQTTHKGKVLWNFMPVFESLWSHAEKNVLPKLKKGPVVPVPEQIGEKPSASSRFDEDLPF